MRIVERSSTEDRKMNAQQLKNAILQEAIEGRLVPQDPNDEPASILLKRIRAEKERLVKEGKLKKKDLEVKPISEDEIPFEIPDSWEWVRLKSLVSILGDGIHGTPEYDITGGYYFINGNNLSKNKIVIKADTKKVNEKEYQTYKKELNDKTILVSINGTIGNVGHYNGEPVILGKSACYYNLIDISLKPYITMLMYTDYFLKYAVENATGSTIKNVSLAVMNDFLVPFPTVSEQHRIVAKIEELLPKVEQYGKAQEELNKLNEELPERLKKSILQEAIEGRLVPQDPNDEPASVLLQKIREEKQQLVKEGKLKKKDLEESPISEDEIPFAIPESWEWVRLSSLLQLISDGTHKTPNYVPIGIPFLSVQNISSGKLTMDKIKYISEEEHNLLIKRVKPALGDILICRIGTLGKALKIYWDFEFSIFVSLGLLRPVNERLTDYIVFCINSPLGFNWIQNHKVGGGTHTYKINLGDMPNMLIPIPPFPEQKRIKLKIEQIFAEIDKLKK